MATRPDYAARIQRIQKAMADQQINLLILDFSANFTYLTGIPYPHPNPTGAAFPNEWLQAAMVTTDRDPVLATSGPVDEWQEEAASRPWIADVQGYDGLGEPREVAQSVLSQFDEPSRVAVSGSGSVSALLPFQKALPETQFTQAESLFWPLRMIKDRHELDCLRRAADLTEKAFGAALRMMRIGVTLQDIANEIETKMLEHGASGVSFPVGVIFNGPGFEGRGGKDRFVPLQPGCMVAFDIGMVYKNYCSDFGRSVIVGEPRPEYLEHYRMLREARDAAVERAAPGVAGSAVHEEMHRVFADHGWEREGRAGFGHNLGLDVHEPPFIFSWDDRALEEGMVLTLEPRAYRNGIVGGRIEDMILITSDGAEALTGFSLEPLILD